MSLSATVAEAATILPVTPVAHPRNSVVFGRLHLSINITVERLVFIKSKHNITFS
jgi:hypothetical protein